MAARVDLPKMPACSDCANFTETASGVGECRMAGPVPGPALRAEEVTETQRCSRRLATRARRANGRPDSIVSP
jgi:hypothetical protein